MVGKGLAVVNLASGFTWVQLVFIFPESFVFLVFKREWALGWSPRWCFQALEMSL